MDTAVADTSALVSLAVPSADATYDTEVDPLQYLLTSCAVFVPEEVIAELEDIAQYSDLHAAAASNVLSAREFYAVEDPYAGEDAPDERPTIGLDDGETDGIVLANARSVDAFLTDEFGSTDFALIHAALEGPRLVPSPRLIRDYALAGHVSAEDAREVIERIGTHRSWDGSPYVERLLDSL
ncbi:MAG: hypothetical protein ABEJ55_05555 [Halanaeroarchaeum sp.]